MLDPVGVLAPRYRPCYMNAHLVKIALPIGTRKQGKNLALRSPDQSPLSSERCGSPVTSLHTPGLHLGWQGWVGSTMATRASAGYPGNLSTGSPDRLPGSCASRLLAAPSCWCAPPRRWPSLIRPGPIAFSHFGRCRSGCGSAHSPSSSARDWINDGLMTLFFF